MQWLFFFVHYHILWLCAFKDFIKKLYWQHVWCPSAFVGTFSSFNADAKNRDRFVYVPIQRETILHYNVVSHLIPRRVD